jgi:uncharacterized protein (TIGR03032 family)
MPAIKVFTSRHFPDWLAENDLALAVTAYQAGRLLMIGRNETGGVAVCERAFDRCTGLCVTGDALWMGSAFQVWKFTAAPDVDPADGCDRLYVPRVGHTTGDVDAHDLAVDGAGRVVVVSTALSCLGTLDDAHGLRSVWRPPFVSRTVPEDRCHLNGLAVRDGRPRYVTVCGRSDVADGWRDHRRAGGCVLDVETGDVVADGLSMPHSPRWHADRLWVLDSGRGDLGYVDPGTGRFERVAFCPGYGRGLAFAGGCAVVGLSRPREVTFRGLDLDAVLAARGAAPWCGLQVVDLRTGTVAHWLRVEAGMDEVYDVAVLPGVTRPKALGFAAADVRRRLWVPDVAESQVS